MLTVPFKHWGSVFPLHLPSLQVRNSLPTSSNPLRQRYLALERPMFIAIRVFSGGYFKRPRSRLTHLLSYFSTIGKNVC